MTQTPLRLLIADPHELFRKSLVTVVSGDSRFEVLEAGSWEETLSLLPGMRLDVLVIGLEIGNGQELAMIRDLRDRFPNIKLLLLGRDDTDEKILQYLQNGAQGYLFRNQSLSELLSALEIVAHGETVCSPQVAHYLFSRLGDLGRERRRRERLDILELTAREMEILRLMADGLSNQEIARRLYLSVHTVKNHVHKILETLGVSSRWAAVSHAFSKGWLQERRRMS